MTVPRIDANYSPADAGLLGEESALAVRVRARHELDGSVWSSLRNPSSNTIRRCQRECGRRSADPSSRDSPFF
jgi:hypothetical protein